MTDTLPFSLSPSPPASASGFTWARHSLAYLRHSVGRCPLPLQDLAARCGYRKLAKFDRRRKEWNLGRGWIPLTYLDALAVDLALLRDLIDLDRREHAAALLRRVRPLFAAVCLVLIMHRRLGCTSPK